jgi:hypothetical protein
MIQRTFQSNEFKLLKSLSKNLEVKWDSNSQSGSSLGSAKVHSFTLSCILGNMRCNSQVSFLAHTFVSLCFGRELKARVITLHIQNKQWKSHATISNNPLLKLFCYKSWSIITNDNHWSFFLRSNIKLIIKSWRQSKKSDNHTDDLQKKKR